MNAIPVFTFEGAKSMRCFDLSSSVRATGNFEMIDYAEIIYLVLCKLTTPLPPPSPPTLLSIFPATHTPMNTMQHWALVSL